jgi:hypothetical protein
MLEGLFAGLAGQILSALFKGLFDGIFGYVEQKDNERTQRQLGEQTTLAKINQEAADAERRASEVGVPSVDDFIDGLKHGAAF